MEEDQHISRYSCAYNKVPEKENDFNEKQVNFVKRQGLILPVTEIKFFLLAQISHYNTGTLTSNGEGVMLLSEDL